MEGSANANGYWLHWLPFEIEGWERDGNRRFTPQNNKEKKTDFLFTVCKEQHLQKAYKTVYGKTSVAE